MRKIFWLSWKDWSCLSTSVSISSSIFYKWKFWYPGEAGPQVILMIIFLVNNGGDIVFPISGEIIIIFMTKFFAIITMYYNINYYNIYCSCLLCWEFSLRSLCIWHRLVWEDKRRWELFLREWWLGDNTDSTILWLSQLYCFRLIYSNLILFFMKYILYFIRP